MKLYHELAEYYYTIEEENRNIDNDVSLILSLLKDIENPSLLDLGCGTGEHLNALSNSGVFCVGIDSSDSMLSVAKSRFDNVFELEKKDMRYFDYNERFDIVTTIFGSINYMIHDADVNKVFYNTYKSLKKKGMGLFEVWNSEPLMEIREKPITRVTRIDYEDKVIERERGFQLLDYPGKTVVEVNYNYNINNETLKDRHIMRAFTKDEIEYFIQDNGFRICNVFSNSEREPYSKTSNSIVIHFEK